MSNKSDAPDIMDQPLRSVCIAGATGFVGSALAKSLCSSYKIVCLTRNKIPEISCSKNIEWRPCDLFSLLQCEHALEGVDTAFYLVHSMLRSARLTQGFFQDLDLIIADNFARAAHKMGVKHIVYLSGLVPDDPNLSRHLRSRLEVEKTLGSRGVPVTSLRAGIVVGVDGSSFSMLQTLVRRVFVIPCPPWTSSLTQPVALSDVLRLLRYSLENPSPKNAAHDVGCPDILSYRTLLVKTSELLAKKRIFVKFPFRNVRLYKYALSLLTGASVDLVCPLLESMRHSMVAKDREFQKRAGVEGISFERAVKTALEAEKKRGSFASVPKQPKHEQKTVRSVQRTTMPDGKSARWLAEQFAAWLPKFFPCLISVKADEKLNIRFYLGCSSLLLLELQYSEDRSEGPDRQLFYVTGGALVRRGYRTTLRPRLELREVLGGKCALMAIHDYRPTLPWFFYNITQALLHVFVMRRFASHIKAFSKKSPD